MSGGAGTATGGTGAGYGGPAYPQLASPSSSASGSGYRSPFSYAPTSASSLPSSSLVFARPMRSISPRPPATSLQVPSSGTGAPAGPSRSSEDFRRGEQGNYSDEDEEETDSMSQSASHSSLPRTAKKIRRTHARRSCLACRKRKARCELPDITVPSSMDPLPHSVKCHRCKMLDTDCVVWDGDRKMKGDRPARYGPPQDKIAAGRGGSASHSTVRAGRSPKAEEADGSGSADFDAAPKKRKAPPPSTNRGQHAGPAPLAMREPHLQTNYEQAVPNLRTIPIYPATVERYRARNLALSTEEVVDNITPWTHSDELLGARQSVNDSSSLPSSNVSTASGGYAANHTMPAEVLLSRAATRASGQQHPSPLGLASDSRRDDVICDGPETFGQKLEARDYRMKLVNAAGRTAALMSEIIYGAPEYRARAREGETVAYAYRGVPVVDEGTVPRDKVEALIRAHPFLSPELVNPVSEDADPASGRVFLSNIVSYLCLKPDPPPDLTSFVIRHSSVHVVMQTRNREICQALLLLVLYEPTDMLLGKPAHDADVQLDHVPGHHLYQAAMSCAISLGLDRVIPNMSSGPDTLTPASSLQRRMSRLRDAALWLTVSTMGVGQAFANARPQLPVLFPSIEDIQAFQDAIQPLLSASAKDNAALASLPLNRGTRQNSASSNTSGASHPPLTYQALAISLHICGQRAEMSFRVRTLWTKVSPYDFCDTKHIVSLGSLVMRTAKEILDRQRRHMLEVEDMQAYIARSSALASATPMGVIGGAPNDPVISILFKWSELEILEILQGLNVRLAFSIIVTGAVRQRSLSRMSAFEGIDALEPVQADILADLCEWANWANERLLHLASCLVALHTVRSKQADDNLESRPGTADYPESSRYMHLIPHFQFCAIVFVAAKHNVEHKLFLSPGSGGLGPECKSTLAILRRAVRNLVTIAQRDRLSLPGIGANVLREFARRFALLVKKREEVAVREGKKEGGSKTGSGTKTDASKARGGNHKIDSACARFTARSVNAAGRIRELFGDSAGGPPGPVISRSGEVLLTSEEREAGDRTRHFSDTIATSDNQGFDQAGIASAGSAPKQQQPRASPGFDFSSDHQQQQQRQQQQEQQQQYFDHCPQLSIQLEDSHILSTPVDQKGSNDSDGLFSASSAHWFNELTGGATPGGQDSTVLSSFGDYTHATLDHLLGTLEDEFMGFPLEALFGFDKDAMGNGPLAESISNHWAADSFRNENGPDLASGGAGGRTLSSGYAAEYPQDSSPATYTHVSVATGSGPSPGASSYSSGPSSVSVANGLSISGMISHNGIQTHQAPSAPAHYRSLSSQPAPYAHHGHTQIHSQGQGPSPTGHYPPGFGLPGGYPTMGGQHAPVSGPTENAPLTSSYAYFGDARRGTHAPGLGSSAAPSEHRAGGEPVLVSPNGGHPSHADSATFYTGSASQSGGAGSTYQMSYGGGGGASGGGPPGDGAGLMQQQQQTQEQQQQHQQNYQHAAPQQYQHHHQQQQYRYK